MNENSITITTPTTPENNANSSIHKVKSGVTNKIFNSLSNSLSKWFSPSDRNGSSRKRECETDIKLNEMTPGSTVAPTSIKRFRSEQDETQSHPTTSKNLYSTHSFSSSTPTLTPNRRMLGTSRNSPPYNFGDQSLTNTTLKSHKTATTLFEDNGENSSDDETNTNDDVILSGSYTNLRSNRKCLNIPPRTRPVTSTNKLYSIRTSSVPRNHCPSANRIANDTEQEASFNGTLNESASESEDSSSRITFTQPNKYTSNRSQSSAGRINTSLVRDDESDLQRRPSGLFGTCSKRSRPTNNELLNFSAHLQTKKSLFSEKNMPNSLNNSTTSLNSLNRRQSLNTSLYGSTSALSDSHTTNTNSPFYNGRTMYGGASGCPRRAISVQRPLRVPTQIRSSSSLSTLYSSTNSLANVEPNTSALSSTAKRILDLMNQCTTPLNDVKRMASNVTNQSPVLVNHHKRFDDNDMMLNRSMRLSTPKTPYSRPGVNNTRKSPPTNELQVPSMSQLLQIKKTFQNNTEKVREIATASNSILNQTGEYKLPNNSNSTSVSQGKRQNKMSTTRGGVKNVEEETVEEVNLPNISLPIMKDIADIGSPQFECTSWLRKPNTIFDVERPTSMKQPTLSLPALVVTEATQTREVDTVTTTKSKFSFSSPMEIKMPSFGKNIEPVNNFKFSEPINVEKSKNSLIFSSIQSEENQVKELCQKTLPQLKNASVLEALDIPKTLFGSSTTSTLPPGQQSLSLLFKSSSKQWECSCCMIKNDDSKDKCAACETPRNKPPQKTEQIASVPLINSFGSQFKASTNTWECSACMIRNKVDAQKCVACETAKPAAIEKTLSSLPNLSSNDQGFKSIVAQQSARWECTACMTRNDANRKKCECCEQAKPGTSSDKTPSFNFGSSSASASAQKFRFGVPFNEKAVSAVVPITEPKATIGEIKSTFSFGVQPNINETDGPVKTFSFGDQTKAKVEEKNKDALVKTFSFGVQQSITSNQDEYTASDKVVSTPAVSGFKFNASSSISQNRPMITTVTFGSNNNNSTADDNVTETRSNELVFDSKNENIFKSPSNNTSGVVIPLATTTTNSAITFGSPKNDQKIPIFGTPTSKADSIVNTIAQVKSPSFALPTTTLVQLSAPQSISNAIISSKTCPVFAFGQKENAAKGALFTSVPAAQDKQAFHKPDFSQSKTKSTTPTVTFGSSSNVTVTTAAPITNSSSFFGQPATVGGFSFGANSASIEPNAFGGQSQQAATANSITSSLPKEPATSSFLFRSTPTIEATPSFGQNPTLVQSYGFGSQAQTPAASFSAYGSTLTNNAPSSAFGTASPFGSTGNATAFGSTGNNGLNTFGTSNSFVNPPSGFGSMIRTAPPSSDEPSAKKAHSPAFGSLSNTVRYGNTAEGFIDIDKQKPPAFSFGDSSNNNNAKKSFAFSATAPPSFNFSGSQQTNSAPYTFGSTATPSAGAFNFGSGSTEANSPNTPFQFAGSSDVTNNLFAPQSSTNSAAVQQRRKIRAVRRNPR